MSEIITDITKNSREVIRVELSEFNGRPLFNTRVWFTGDDDELHPGKSGIAFKIELLPEFAEAVQRAAAAARKAGLLP